MSPINSKKNIVQDVMPPKRSIREVELSPRHKTKSVADIPTVSKPTKSADKDVFERPVSLKKNSGIKKTLPEYDYNEDPKNNHRFGLWIALSIFVLALAFGISSFWKGAIIKITPKNETAGFNEIFSAKKNTAGADLSFQTVTVTEDSSASVAATGQKQVDTNASGRIIIYNKGSISQKLIATTRFETPEGLIFRLNSAVTVPAQKGTLPGSVEGLVTADRPGESYNIGLKDFTLPGLKGTSKYTQIFARSKTSISGGFSGIKKIVSDEILNETDRSLESNLRQDMARNLLSQIPDNYILYPQSITFSFEPTGQVSTTTSDSSTAILRKKGTATGVIFDKGALTRAIISKVLPDVSGDNVKITNLDTLSFSVSTSSIGRIFSQENTTIDFRLSGQADFVWVFDADKLKSDLLGLPKDKARTLITTYKSIEEAWITTQPFWNRTIPNDLNKVKIINTIESVK